MSVVQQEQPCVGRQRQVEYEQSIRNEHLAPLGAPCPDSGRDFTEVVLQYGSLVKKLAAWWVKRAPKGIEYEDILQSGRIGLWKAIIFYREEYGIPFTAYAKIRMGGEIIDEFRRHDHLPRGLRKLARTLEDIEYSYMIEHGCSPSVEQILALTGWNEGQLLTAWNAKRPLSNIDSDVCAIPCTEGVCDPCDTVAMQERLDKLNEIIKSLSDKERIIISLYYAQGYTMTQIAQTIGLSQGRVSQIHMAALRKLKDKMTLQKEFETTL